MLAELKTAFNHRFGDGRAFLEDPRFYDAIRNEEISKYLPEGFKITQGPIDLSPWTFALRLNEDIGRKEFEEILKEDYEQGISGFNSSNEDGVMVYSYISPDPDGIGSVPIAFAGQYVGNGRVRSLYARGASVLEHDQDVNPVNFHLDDMDRTIFWSSTFYSKKK